MIQNDTTKGLKHGLIYSAKRTCFRLNKDIESLRVWFWFLLEKYPVDNAMKPIGSFNDPTNRVLRTWWIYCIYRWKISLGVCCVCMCIYPFTVARFVPVIYSSFLGLHSDESVLSAGVRGLRANAVLFSADVHSHIYLNCIIYHFAMSNW